MDKIIFSLSLIFAIAIAPQSGNAAGTLLSLSQASDSLSLIENVQILDDEFSKLKISEKQNEALMFQSLGLYQDVNLALRNEDPNLLSENALKICAIDSSTQMMSFQGITLYRGHNYLGKSGTTIDGIVSDRAFISTSISEKTALRFAGKKTPHVMDVIEPSQKPMIGIWMGKVTMVADEYEILLKRNTQFKITAIEKKMTEKGELIVRHLNIIEPFETPVTDQILSCKE